MAQRVGSLVINLALESGAFRSGLDASTKELRAATKRMQAIGESMRGIGEKISLAVTAPLAALGAKAIQGFVAQEQAMGQVRAALQSMGNASGKTATELSNMADKLEMRSLFDADVILKQVTANLLTFGNISGQMFDRAQQAAIDMATRLGGEPQAAAIQLGKALNNPIEGINALSRVGIKFTAQQKAMIAEMVRTGQVAAAQNVIMNEVERQFRGAAAAAADASPWRKAQVAMGQAGDAIGAQLLPMIQPITEAIVSVMRAFNELSPEMQGFAVKVGLVAAATGPVLMGLGAMVSTLSPLVPLFIKLGPAIAVVSRAFAALALTPVGLTIMGIAAAVGAVYFAWKNWDKIKAIIANLYAGVKTWLVDKLGAVWDWVIGKLATVGNAFFKLYDAVVGHSYIPDMVDGIAEHMARLDGVMVDPTKKATSAAAQAFQDMADQVRPILDRLFPEARALADYQRELGLVGKAEAKGVLSSGQAAEAVRRLRGLNGDYAPEIGAMVIPEGFELAAKAMERARAELDLLYKVANDNGDKVGAVNVRIAKSFKEMADDTLGALQGLANSLKGGGFLDILGSVVNLLTQLGSVGLFGKKTQTNINKAVPGYANGTSFHGGGLAIVGERGPELVSLPRGSGVIPNHKLARAGSGGGGNTYILKGNLMTPEFWRQINEGDMAAADAGGRIGQRRTAYRQSRRLA